MSRSNTSLTIPLRMANMFTIMRSEMMADCQESMFIPSPVLRDWSIIEILMTVVLTFY